MDEQRRELRAKSTVDAPRPGKPRIATPLVRCLPGKRWSKASGKEWRNVDHPFPSEQVGRNGSRKRVLLGRRAFQQRHAAPAVLKARQAALGVVLRGDALEEIDLTARDPVALPQLDLPRAGWAARRKLRNILNDLSSLQ